VRWFRLCCPADLDAEVRRMQAMHADEIEIAFACYTAGPPTAKRVMDEGELLLDAGGYRMGRGGRFFVLSVDELQDVLTRAAELTGVPLMSEDDRQARIRARAAARAGRDWL
jgi:hypothetical protein